MLSNYKIIEIETSQYCNRSCSWCTNNIKTQSRKSERYMDINLYLKLLEEINKNNFKGVISFSHYNEPLQNVEQNKKYWHITKILLPEIKLVTNTNGDYITKENFKSIHKYIDELSIMDYDNKGSKYWINKINNIKGTVIESQTSRYIYGFYKNMKFVIALNWPLNFLITNRAGQLDIPGHKRKQKCYEPFKYIGIDYKGNVTPCCNIRNEFKDHQFQILGNIKYNNLVEIINNKKQQKFKNKMVGDTEQYPDICKYCNKNGGRYTRDKEPGIRYDIK